MNARVIKEVPLEFIQALVANVKPTTRGAVWTNQYEDVPFSFRTGRVSRIINNPTCVLRENRQPCPHCSGRWHKYCRYWPPRCQRAVFQVHRGSHPARLHGRQEQ